MFTMYSHDYIIQQAGLIQKGDINMRIPGYLLQRNVLMSSTKRYRPIQSSWISSTPIRRETNLSHRLIFGDRCAVLWRRKQALEQCCPAQAVPGKSPSA